jgi:hypothetical protein
MSLFTAIEQTWLPIPVTIPLNQALPALPADLRSYSRALLITPAALDATTKIGFKALDNATGTPVPVKTAANALEELTVDLAAANAYEVPAGVLAAGYLWIWTENAGANVLQAGGARNFILLCKS